MYNVLDPNTKKYKTHLKINKPSDGFCNNHKLRIRIGLVRLVFEIKTPLETPFPNIEKLLSIEAIEVSASVRDFNIQLLIQDYNGSIDAIFQFGYKSTFRTAIEITSKIAETLVCDFFASTIIQVEVAH